jgi:hypothetical protein
MGFGLTGMSERAKLLDGQTLIESTKGSGTIVSIILPLNTGNQTKESGHPLKRSSARPSSLRRMRCTCRDVPPNKSLDRFTLLMLFGRQGRLKSREVADNEEQVEKPEGEPDRCDDTKPQQEQDQTWRKEHRGVTQKPEAIR